MQDEFEIRSEIALRILRETLIDLRRIARWTGLTQEQVTARLQIEGCDLTRSSYAKIEAGLQHISVRQLWALCRILKTAPEELLRLDESF